MDIATLGINVDASKLKAATVAQDNFSNSADRMAASSTRATAAIGRGAGTATHHAANLTFQLQDIAMMMVSGQNPFMLAMQQGTQVSGIFQQMGGTAKTAMSGIASAFAGLLNPLSLITVGTIAASAAMVGWLTSSTEEASKLSDQIDKLQGGISDLQEVNDLFADSDLSKIRDEYGGLTEDVKRLLALQAEFAVADIMSGSQGAIRDMIASTEGWITSSVGGIRDIFGTTYANAVQIKKLMDNMASAATPAEALGAAQQLRKQIESTIGPMNSLKGAGGEMARQLVTIEGDLNKAAVQAARAEKALGGAATNAGAVKAALPGGEAFAGAVAGSESLGGNLFRARGFIIAATLALTAYFIPSIYAAAAGVVTAYLPAVASAVTATGVWIASLITLRGALMATGIGAIVVLIGLAINAVLNFVESVGGLGNALRIVGILASGVWQSIVAGAQMIPAGLSAVWNSIKGSFSALMSYLMNRWADFLSMLNASLPKVPGWVPMIGGAFDGLADSAARARDTAKQFGDQSTASFAQASSAMANGTAAWDNAVNTFQGAWAEMNAEIANAKKIVPPTTAAITDLGNATDSYAGKAGGAAKETEKLTNEFEGPLKSAVGSVADAFGDFVASGFKDFKGFVKNIVNSFKKMISQLISTAIKNKIMISLGLDTSGASGVSGLAGGLAGGNAGGGGGLGSITSLFKGGGGLSKLFGGGVSSMLGTIGLIAGGIALIASFFKKKVTLLAQGMRITINGIDAVIDTFKKTKTEKYWGLSKKTRTKWERASDDIANPIQQIIDDIGGAITNLAKSIGLGGDLSGFKTVLNVDTMGMSRDEASKAVEAALENMSDKMAAFVLGAEGIAAKIAGETETATLTRLAKSLDAVNSAFSSMNYVLNDISIKGAIASAQLVEMVGGLDAFNTASNYFYENYFSQAERQAKATEVLTAELKKLGVALPESKSAYRDLVEQSVAAGTNELTALLLKSANIFDFIKGKADDMNDAANDNSPGNSMFRTRAEQVYAQSSEGYRRNVTSLGPQELALMRETVTAIREGDINQARLTNQLVRIQERLALDPENANTNTWQSAAW